MVKVARRVKLVEKGIPESEQDQIRGQEGLKRSLQGLRHEEGLKRPRLDEGVIDVRRESFGDYSDIADIAEDDEPEQEQEQHYSSCICSTEVLARCPHCPFYFLEAEQEQELLPGEAATLVAKISGNQGELRRELSSVRLLPFPFKFLTQASFSLLRSLGARCLVPSPARVRGQDWVFGTVRNTSQERVTVRQGDVLGIVQGGQKQEAEHDDQEVGLLVGEEDLQKDEKGGMCGFVRLEGERNYQYKLVRLELEPEVSRRWRLLKKEVTVQTRSSVWVQLEPKKQDPRSRSLWKLLKDGKLGKARSAGTEEMVKKVVGEKWEKEPANLLSPKESSNLSAIPEPPSKLTAQETQNAYDTMLAKIDQDMAVPGPGAKLVLEDALTSRIYKGVVGPELVVEPGASTFTSLFLSDEELPPSGLKSLLKFRAKVTNNEEFKYYNNCYDIAEQVVTITNGICRATRSTRPCVKVRITNPRGATAVLKPDSPIGLVRIHLEDTDTPVVPSPAPTAMMEARTLPIPPPIIQAPPGPQAPAPARGKPFNTAKHLEKQERRTARRWDQLVVQGVWQKSLTVEERWPFFSKSKLKTPFGLKDKELNMRVGASQESRPVKVLDKVNGVFSCFICDVVVLDKYSCQDHW